MALRGRPCQFLARHGGEQGTSKATFGPIVRREAQRHGLPVWSYAGRWGAAGQPPEKSMMAPVMNVPWAVAK